MGIVIPTMLRNVKKFNSLTRCNFYHYHTSQQR